MLYEAIGSLNSVGFVPTMGGIHKGHISLINKSKKNCKKTLVSIFINPKQFNNKNDFKKYPSNINKDLFLLKKTKKLILFIFHNLRISINLSKNQKSH